MTLYKFSLKENYAQLQDLLVQSGPTTTTLLGWFLGTGMFELDPADECDIWTTSHSDPFQSQDPVVVWIFESVNGIRVFVSSEVVLDLGEFTPEAIELSQTVAYEEILPTYFVDSQLEILYNQSKLLLESAIKEYMKNKETNVFVHGLNLLWLPVVSKVLTTTIAGTPCFKFIKPSSSFDAEKKIGLPKGLKLTNLESRDVDLVRSTNKISYELSYVQDCIRISSAIRRTDTDELIAWGMTHRNFLVGSLHVLPAYRRKGYAEPVLDDLCRQYKKIFQSKIPARKEEKELYFCAAVEKPNIASFSRFKKSGWTTFGLGNIWFFASK
ncbi:hypothetical protein BD770DRAFT_376387 [Pilaira anomala]|nr:hypothetical protein BD770DRAFT_376387 [Pilaira anomala]